MRSEDYIESTYQYETTDVQMRNGKAVRPRHRRLIGSAHIPPGPGGKRASSARLAG